MFSVLFWNLHGRKEENRERRNQNLLDSIARLTTRHQLDMLVFAECGIEGTEIERRLNGAGLGPFHSPTTKSRRIRFFTRLDESAIREMFFDPIEDRLSILEIDAGKSGKILLAGAHFHDRMSIPHEGGRAMKARTWARAIETIEDAAEHERTVLVGDLNMNPFEGGLVEADALHAVMTRALASTVTQLKARKNLEKSRPFRCFYNNGPTNG